jgi:hypothetical protein
MQTRLAEPRERLDRSQRRRPTPKPRLDPRHAALLRLQRSVGNRAVARQVVDAGTATGPEADAKKLAEKAPDTNVAFAQWIVDADAQSFVKWEYGETQGQFKTLADGKKVGDVDPARAAIFVGLQVAHDLVKGAVDKWLVKTSDPKPTVTLGSFIRPHGPGHQNAEMIDINDLRFTGAEGPADVLAALGSLTPASYGIGLPFQGEFFPAELQLAGAQKREEEKATAEKRDPAPIEHALTLFTTKVSSATWDATNKRWDVKDTSGRAEDHLKSAALEKGLGELRGKGYSFYVFPDNPAHIHIQKG